MEELFVIISTSKNTVPFNGVLTMIIGYVSSDGTLKCNHTDDTVLQLDIEGLVRMEGFTEKSGINKVENPKYLTCHAGNFWFSNEENKEIVEDLI